MKIAQARISRAVGLRNQIEVVREELHNEGEELFNLIEEGAEIEPGTHNVRMKKRRDNSREIRELWLDGRPPGRLLSGPRYPSPNPSCPTSPGPLAEPLPCASRE